MPDVRYVPLQVLFPHTHRVTLYRWRRDGKIPKPDLKIGNREYYREDRQLAPPAEAERPAQQKNTKTT